MPRMDSNTEELEFVKPAVENGVYKNPWKEYEDLSFRSVMKFLWTFVTHPNMVPGKEVLDEKLPVEKPDFYKLTHPPISGIQTTWIGHASVLVQFDGMTILTDPVFSDRCSPFPWFGTRRYRPVPCEVEELPQVDIVLISHSHYDHLDYTSVQRLNKKFGSTLTWYVPLGLKLWMKNAGCQNVVEMTWWEENQHAVSTSSASGFTVACTPAQHWSNRSIMDKNKTLWGSWVVKGPNHSFYFTGDTGYCSAFKDIGKKYGPITLAAIPIGAYEPNWALKCNHVNPEEAVQIHVDIKAENSIGIHWGTFQLSTEPYLECISRIAEAAKRKNLIPGCFFTISHGYVTTVGGDKYNDVD